MWDAAKLVALGLVTLGALIGANYAHDVAYQVHMLIVALTAGGMFLWTVRRTDEPRAPVATGYNDGVVRAGVIATAFWGIAGFLVGTYIAFQLAYPN